MYHLTGWSDLVRNMTLSCASAVLRAIYLPQSDQPVRKIAYCSQVHVLFVKYLPKSHSALHRCVVYFSAHL